MIEPDTRIGGPDTDFAHTAWSLLILRDDASEEDRRAQVERLARLYWKPIYVYLRKRWKKPNEDAKDLTQQFFAWMLETDFLSKVRADRGRFRNFVKASLDRFVLGDFDFRGSHKRGGNLRKVALDCVTGAECDLTSPAESPDTLLRKEWRRTLLEEGLGTLREQYRRESRQLQCSVFEEFYLAPEPGPSYEELSRKFGITAVDVTNYLARARARFRNILKGFLAEGVAEARELEDEFEELFGDGR